jgi:hypothetical protein
MINDLKDFEKFLKICRKQGVTEVTFQGTSVKLGDLPSKGSSGSDEIETDGPTDDELIFAAVGGLPA